MNDHRCDDIISEIYVYLDGEVDGASRLRIEAHLRECSPCLEAFDFEAELRKVVAAHAGEQCPDALRRKIADLLANCDDAAEPVE